MLTNLINKERGVMSSLLIINSIDYVHKELKDVFSGFKVIHFPTCEYIFLSDQQLPFYDVVIIRQNNLDAAINEFIIQYTYQYPNSKIVFLFDDVNAIQASLFDYFVAMVNLPVSLSQLKVIIQSLVFLDQKTVTEPLIFNQERILMDA